MQEWAVMYALQINCWEDSGRIVGNTSLGFELKQGSTFPFSDSLIGKMRGSKNLVKVSFESQETIQLRGWCVGDAVLMSRLKSGRRSFLVNVPRAAVHSRRSAKMDWVFYGFRLCFEQLQRLSGGFVWCPYGVAPFPAGYLPQRPGDLGTWKECDHNGVSEATWYFSKEMVRCIQLAKSTVAKGNGGWSQCERVNSLGVMVLGLWNYYLPLQENVVLPPTDNVLLDVVTPKLCAAQIDRFYIYNIMIHMSCLLKFDRYPVSPSQCPMDRSCVRNWVDIQGKLEFDRALNTTLNAASLKVCILSAGKRNRTAGKSIGVFFVKRTRFILTWTFQKSLQL